jgi:hypothetical protein
MPSLGQIAATQAPASSGSGGGGFLGSLFSHLPSLGLGALAHQIGGIPAGLAALAAGKGGYGNAWGNAAEGFTSSMLGTLESIPGVQPLANATGINDQIANTYGEQYRPQPVWTQIGKEGLLAPIVNTLGNVSLIGGGLGLAAKAGDLGKLAEASDATRVALAAKFTASDVEQATQALRDAGGVVKDAGIASKVLRAAAKANVAADGLTADAADIASRARLVHAADLATHPYQTIFNTAIRPLTQAAQAAHLGTEAAPLADAAGAAVPAADAATAAQGLHDIAQSAPDAALNPTRALLGAAVHEAAPAAAPITMEDQIAKLTAALPKADEAAPAATAAEHLPTNVGPIEDAVRRGANLPPSPLATNIVSHLPEPVKSFLSTVEGHIEAHQTKNVVFERMRNELGARNIDRASEPVQAGVRDASHFLVGKTLDDGTKIGPDLANRLLGDEVMARLSGVKQLEEQAATHAPEAAGAIRDALVKGGDRSAQVIPAAIAADPGFEAAMQHLTEAWHASAGDRLARLTDSRLGGQGLEHAGENAPILTRAQQSELSAIGKGQEHMPVLGRVADRQQAAVEGLIARHQATSARLTDQIKQSVQGATESAPAAFERARGTEVTPGRSLAQEAVTKLPEGVATSAHDAYRRGVVSGRQIEQAAKYGDTADQLIARKGVLDKQVADLTKTINDYKLPGQVAKTKAEAALARRTDKLGNALEDVSGRATPDAWKPVYGALKDLHAEALTNPSLAKALEGLPEKFSTVLDLAAKKGFDPVHIRSFEPAQVRRLVYGQVSLGKQGVELGKTIESGTRKSRLGMAPKTRSLDAFTGALHEATHEDNTNALATYIEDVHRKPLPADGSVPNGWVPWDASKRHLLTESSTSEGVAEKMPFADGMIPVQVKRTLDAFTQSYDHPVFSAIRKASSPWKTLVLAMNPGWYVNHFIGHLVGATVAGARVQDFVKGWQEYRSGGADLGTNAVTSHIGRGANAFSDMPSITNRSFVSDLDKPQMIQYPRGVAGLKLAKDTSGISGAAVLARQRVNSVIKNIDDISRAAVFNSAKRVGSSDAEALQQATSAFLDYQRMGPFEQQVISSVVPFYPFEKSMMRLVAKFPIDHPVATGFLMTLGNLNQTLNKQIYGTELPDYYKNLIKLPGVGTLNIGKFNPFEHSAGVFTSPQNIAGAMNPFISDLIRNAYGAPSYFPHNAQGKLVAPATRLDQFGVEQPATNLGADIGSTLGGVPLGRFLGSQTGSSAISGSTPTGPGLGIEKFLGVPVMPPAQLQKLLKRVMRFNTAQATKSTAPVA